MFYNGVIKYEADLSVGTGELSGGSIFLTLHLVVVHLKGLLKRESFMAYTTGLTREQKVLKNLIERTALHGKSKLKYDIPSKISTGNHIAK